MHEPMHVFRLVTDQMRKLFKPITGLKVTPNGMPAVLLQQAFQLITHLCT